MHKRQIFGHIVGTVGQRAYVKQLYARFHINPAIFHQPRISGACAVDGYRVGIDFGDVKQGRSLGLTRLVGVVGSYRLDYRRFVVGIAAKR